VVAAQLARYAATATPRAAEFSLGIALRTAGRHDKAVEALLRALKESGTEPPAEDVFLQLAYVHELRGAKDQELRSYLEAVRAAPRWADQILPDLHRLLTPELAPALVGWFASDWETAFSDPSIDAADRLHADLFLCRVHLYSANYEAARAILDRIRKSQPDQFASIVPKLFTPDSAERRGHSGKKWRRDLRAGADRLVPPAAAGAGARQRSARAEAYGRQEPKHPPINCAGHSRRTERATKGGGILRGRQALSLAW
jgi:tetratricopeptide (TPR) repeat protein